MNAPYPCGLCKKRDLLVAWVGWEATGRRESDGAPALAVPQAERTMSRLKATILMNGRAKIPG